MALRGSARVIRKLLACATRELKNSKNPENGARAKELAKESRGLVHQGTNRMLTRALLRLRQALELDRLCAAAHAQMAEALVFKFLHYEGEEEYLRESRRSAARDLDREAESAVAHGAVGFG